MKKIVRKISCYYSFHTELYHLAAEKIFLMQSPRKKRYNQLQYVKYIAPTKQPISASDSVTVYSPAAILKKQELETEGFLKYMPKIIQIK